MRRRTFLHCAGLATGGLLVRSPRIQAEVRGALTPIPSADKKRLADGALTAARSAGASYADVRIGRYRNQFLTAREGTIQGLTDTESYGSGVRVLVGGTWGFAATNDVTPDGLARAAAQAAATARANARLQTEPVRLAAEPGRGEVQWSTPIRQDGFTVPIAEKAELLRTVSEAALAAGADYITAQLFLVNEQKYFASTEGTYADQDVHRIWPTFTVTAVDRGSGRFETRNALSAPIGMGYEYLTPDAADQTEGPTTVLFGRSYDMVKDARLAAEQARAKHSAPSIPAGRYDLVLDPSHLFLTIHESVGHPLELDRVLGYEANYAGTSFATLDKWKSGDFRYGSPRVTLFADKTQPGSLGAVGYDDEGVATKRWDLVKDGILVNYQATRDQVHLLGQTASHGCSYADSWDAVQFQRMPNVSLEPGPAPLTPAQMVAGVDRGIYILGRGSYSIDQQRYNFQFGGQLFYAIEHGRITGLVRDVAYQANTQEFWNACVQICDRRDYRLGGTFNDGKGQPPQSSAVSHGSATTRFDGVTVINTGRRL